MTRAAIDEAGVAALVARFYARARADAMIGPVFNAAVEDWDEHLERLNGFWSSVMLGTGRYKGNPFGAHRPLPLRPEMFDRWLALWAETAAEVFEPEPAAALVDKADRIGASLTAGLFWRPDGAA